MPRIDPGATAPHVYAAMATFDAAARQGLDRRLAELVRIRASQLNRCDFCRDTHVRAARDAGEDERRLRALETWRDSALFTAAERAALALTESMTLISDSGVPAEVFAAAAEHFDAARLTRLVWTIAAINTWNRVAVASALAPPG
ncbi:carboxymuconolactone decarboxylase family protein [Allonocardiopsis opalescens]|uniref:AhpD family alkylhydroperoxidase n=1 Tax=Allonocardiopsis opalescens TaxID=1144618 RepID=A0A2T0QEP1_9ACTN|nr:carboxymuconolactone decarboxylase family protein [Allonocardiopsis opalescens]PRY02389.1 AhpD family alkylhydroperoxidase [Allonocardiopsis opalescens]